jgi:iron complex outermembrane receptor protein
MLYALTTTGFQPGDLRLANRMTFGENGMEVSFYEIPSEEEKLTSYEVGSKNRFLDNRLQVNIGGFFYDYKDYNITVNTNTTGSGAPEYVLIPVDLEMMGIELTIDWLATENDKVAFSLGSVSTEITGYPDIPKLNPTEQWVAEKELSGIPDMTATLSYDHTFVLPTGGSIVPRAEVRYTSSYYTNTEAFTVLHLESGVKPYAYQDDYYVVNIGTTWTSPSGTFSVTGYMRNLFDEEYKVYTTTASGVDAVGVTAGDPQTWGMIANIKF